MSTITTSTPPAPAGAAIDLIRRTELLGADLATRADEHDHTGELGDDVLDRLRAAGLTSMLVPEELGGPGASHATAGEVLRTLGRHEPAVAVTLAMHTHLVAFQVWRHHQGIDASAVLQRVLDGAVLVSTGASDWLGSSGTAQRVEGGYRVSARKAPASGSEWGDVIVTSIRWDDAPDGPQVLHCSVPAHQDGVRIERTWDTLGLRATGSHTVVIDDVFVPDAAVSLVRPADVWHPVWSAVIGAAMPLIMAAYVGIADAAAALATEAGHGKADAATVQLVGELANAHTTAADVLAAMFAASADLRFENTDAFAAATLSRKTVVAEAAIATVRLALEAVGGRSYQRGSGLERLLRDVLGAQFHPLPRARQTQLTGNVALGLAPA
jgi:acyl-CoA dehydrogenase